MLRINLGLVVGLGLLLSGCNAVEKVNELLQASKGQLQAKRALTISEGALKNFSRIDIALAVRAETLASTKPRLLNELNSSEKAQKAELLFKDVTFFLDTQVLSLDVELTKKISDFAITGRLQISSFVGATANALVWNLYADGIQVTKVEGVSSPTEQQIKLIADGIGSLLPILNAILDEVVNDNPEKAILLVFDKKDLIRKELSESSSKDFIFDKKELATGLSTQSTAVLIDKRGVFVAAQVEFVRPDQVQTSVPAFPKDSDLVRISSADWKARAEGYRKAVTELSNLSAKGDLKPLIDFERSGLAVTREALARLINFNFAQGAISGTFIFNKPMKEEKTTLTMEIKRRDCHKYFEGCDFKHVCEGNRCNEEVDQVITKTCKVSCCLSTGLLGCLIPGLCDRACNEVVKVTRPIQGPACDAFRAADTLHAGLLCATASNVSKAVCDVEANVRKSLCDVEQEVARFYEKNPVATVTANATPDARFALSLSQASISPDLNTLQGTLSGSGGGKIHASIEYERHNYADAIVLGPGVSLGAGCAVDWKESVDVNATAQPLNAHMTFTGATSVTPDKAVVFEFKQQGTKIVKADFSPAPLVALFGGKPQVTFNCPLAALGAVLFGVAERVFKEEDARKVLPLLTGEGYPIELKELHFSMKIKPIPLCEARKGADCTTPLLILQPDVTEGMLRYLEPPS